MQTEMNPEPQWALSPKPYSFAATRTRRRRNPKFILSTLTPEPKTLPKRLRLSSPSSIGGYSPQTAKFGGLFLGLQWFQAGSIEVVHVRLNGLGAVSPQSFKALGFRGLGPGTWPGRAPLCRKESFPAFTPSCSHCTGPGFEFRLQVRASAGCRVTFVSHSCERRLTN